MAVLIRYTISLYGRLLVWKGYLKTRCGLCAAVVSGSLLPLIQPDYAKPLAFNTSSMVLPNSAGLRV